MASSARAGNERAPLSEAVRQSDAEPVHRRVAARGRSHPEALAVKDASGKRTFGELTSRAHGLAARLRELSCGRDAVVGILLPRCADLVAAQLGVLEAGAAFLTLDPAHPADRTRFQLEDACVKVVVTGSAMTPPAGAWRALSIEDVDAAPEAPPDGSEPTDLAYVVYTSGSTGRPKGVAVEHRSLANLVDWHVSEFGVGAEDRMSAVAALGFDAFVWEVWPALASGASLHLPDDATRRSAEGLRDFFVARGVTIAFAPTPLAEAMLRMPWPVATRLSRLLTGGDRLHRYPPPGLPFVLVNNYGPTECTVVTTSGAVPLATGSERLPTIGRPIAGAEVLVCDPQGRPLADGAEGELCVGGVLLARGYLGRPDLTRERFVPHPCDAGGRLYRTGDRARFLPDGTLEFLGRLDEQIKVRGVRIEPGEVESALARHPAVAAAAVGAREGPAGARLVAWVVAAAGRSLDADELGRHAREILPEGMVPDVFVPLDELPLGTNGKVDRSALPEPEVAKPLRHVPSGAPRNATEERLAELVAGLLGVEEVGVEDNFFLMGGHSLLGTQVIARVRQLFGVQLSLRSLFDAPTVAQLSSEIDRRRAASPAA